MFWKKRLKVYDEHEIEAIEGHIATHFGEFGNVIHEIVSPDIHVDICIIAPTMERNYYVLVTMGMGAHKMKVPKELRNMGLDRAEMLVALPPYWDIQSDDERWFWPIRWLKILARLPGEYKTWLGYGHTVPNGEPFADNTRLSGVLVTMPYSFGVEASSCTMPDGNIVNFYQMVPLYEEEMDFKIKSSAETLEDFFPEDFDMVVDIARECVLR